MKVTKALLALLAVTFLTLNGMQSSSTQTQTIEKDPQFQKQVQQLENKARKKRCKRISALKCCIACCKSPEMLLSDKK